MPDVKVNKHSSLSQHSLFPQLRQIQAETFSYHSSSAHLFQEHNHTLVLSQNPSYVNSFFSLPLFSAIICDRLHSAVRKERQILVPNCANTIIVYPLLLDDKYFLLAQNLTRITKHIW